jgi:hypothetical protein
MTKRQRCGLFRCDIDIPARSKFGRARRCRNAANVAIVALSLDGLPLHVCTAHLRALAFIDDRARVRVDAQPRGAS